MSTDANDSHWTDDTSYSGEVIVVGRWELVISRGRLRGGSVDGVRPRFTRKAGRIYLTRPDECLDIPAESCLQ